MNILLITFIITLFVFILFVFRRGFNTNPIPHFEKRLYEHLQVPNKGVLHNIQSTADTCNEKDFRLNQDIICDDGYVLKDFKLHAARQRPAQAVIDSYWGKPPSGMTWEDLANTAQNGRCLPCYNNIWGTCKHVWTDNTTGRGFTNWYNDKNNMRTWGMNNYRGCDLQPTLADIEKVKCCKLQVNNVDSNGYNFARLVR